MSRWIAGLALAGAFAGAAQASGYDDYMRGVEAMRVSASDLAIEAFTQALGDGDLAAAYVPVAHFDRAALYLGKGQCATALADLDEALKLKPDYLDAYRMRAGALQCLDRRDDAIADLTAALAQSKDPEIYRQRGRLHWDDGQFAAAADDFAAAAALDRKAAYAVLWYAISAARAGSLDQAKLADMAGALGDDWPYALLDYFRGKATADDVYKQAAGDAAGGRKCEADFYIAEWQLTHDAAASAKDLLQQAQKECPKNFVEYGAAQIELRRVP
jgi:lipoprotein NlpI